MPCSGVFHRRASREKMIYDLTNKLERRRALVKLRKMLSDKDTIEIKKITRRSKSQNSYLHVLFALWGSETGYTVEESKSLVKRALGYTYEKDGEVFPMSTRKFTTDEMSVLIDRFRMWSSDHGIYLPSSEEYYENYAQIMNQVQSEERFQ